MQVPIHFLINLFVKRLEKRKSTFTVKKKKDRVRAYAVPDFPIFFIFFSGG